jgi:hypothetical protein
MRVCVLVVAVAAAMTFSAVSLATLKTTGPNTKVTVLVLINDQGIRVFMFAGALGADGKTEQNVGMAVTGGVPRGDYLSFNVYNRGKKVHNFTIFGKKTSPIKPGGKAHLFVQSLRRGNFLYQSTLDTNKKYRGQLTVF